MSFESCFAALGCWAKPLLVSLLLCGVSGTFGCFIASVSTGVHLINMYISCEGKVLLAQPFECRRTVGQRRLQFDWLPL